jgi:hypothetical protein
MPYLAEFGIVDTVSMLFEIGNGAQRTIRKPAHNPEQTAYLALAERLGYSDKSRLSKRSSSTESRLST